MNLLSREWGVDARTDGGKSVWAEFDLLRVFMPDKHQQRVTPSW